MVRSNYRAERFVTYSVIKFEYYTFVTALFQQGAWKRAKADELERVKGLMGKGDCDYVRLWNETRAEKPRKETRTDRVSLSRYTFGATPTTRCSHVRRLAPLASTRRIRVTSSTHGSKPKRKSARYSQFQYRKCTGCGKVAASDPSRPVISSCRCHVPNIT